MDIRTFALSAAAALATSWAAHDALGLERVARAVSPPDISAVRSVAEIRDGAHAELTYRTLFAGPGAKKSIPGSDYALQTTSSEGAPRIAARSGAGPVAVVVRLRQPETVDAGRGALVHNPARFALITLQGTKVSVFAYFDDLPEDRVLASYVSDAVAGKLRALARFDPKFTPGKGVGSERFILK